MRLLYIAWIVLSVIILSTFVHLVAPLPINPVPVETLAEPLSPENIYPLNLEPYGSVNQLNPESLAVDSHQRLYSGSEDGWIYLTSSEGEITSSRRWAYTGGYPIGMAFDQHYDLLWVANYPLGLQKVSSRGEVTTVIGQYEGVPIGFADDVVVSRNNIVYFTDASTRFNPRTVSEDEPSILWELLEGRANGRVFAYNPEIGQTSVIVSKAYFPSGITLTLDESALLFVEISRNRIMRHWLSGPKVGNTEVFVDKLPGIPDDVIAQGDGRVWVSLVSPRDEFVDKWIQPYPWVKELLVRLPNSWLVPMQYPQPGGSLLQLDSSGQLRCQFLIEPPFFPSNVVFSPQGLYVGTLLGYAPGHAHTSAMNGCEGTK